MHALVTGANGHLGFNLVLALRAAGHRVRASVRSLHDAAKTAPLRELGDVELVAADVTDAAALRRACEGVDVLFHVAAVYSLTEKGRDDEILRSAREGAGNALRAAAAAGVRQVVLTSSTVTLPLTAPGAPPSTESDWNADLRVPYFRAKVEAERLAWPLAKELGLKLATILPAGIIGPGFARRTPTLDLVAAMAGGAFRLGAPNGNFGFVDARDCAQAHLLAAEQGAEGRFIAAYDEQLSYTDIVRQLHRVEPRIGRPLMTLPTLAWPLLPLLDRMNARLLGTPQTGSPEVVACIVSGKRWNYRADKARRELGWQPRFSQEQSLRDTLAALAAVKA
jgi:dihydroflavonol-4-reductase